ncbi:MAG: hypothetical protein JNL34_15435 [Anaerolineae bacterium]|nr:hypothetical protein [Anaerolineae bacterium]
MRKLGLFAVIVMALLVSIGVIAQDSSLESFNECDLAGLSSAITESIASAGDDEETLDTVLGEAASAISRVRAACAGLSFEGNNAKLIGQITLDEGHYRVRVTTPGFFSASLDVLDGGCNAGFMGLFNLFQGQATDGAEVLVTSQGCEALVNTQNVTDAWTLSFEKLD